MPQHLAYSSKCHEECLFYRLVELLGERGWERLGLGAWIKSARIRQNGFQEVAIRLLVWNGVVARSDRIRGAVLHTLEHRGRLYRFIFGRGEERAEAAYYQSPRCTTQPCITRHDLVELLPPAPRPLIVIDLSQLPEHNMDEVSSMRRQIAATLGVIRGYLWDRHLLLTSAPEGVRAWLRSFMHTPFVSITDAPTDEALDARGYHGPRILLDPNAEEELKPSEVLEAEVFILGGIVDKRPRPGATSRLPIERAARRRIALRGSIIGVPHTLNALVEVLLRARYLYNGDVERALYDVIPPHEARIRAYVEITRRARGGRVTWELYEELRRWLPLRPRDFEKAARMAGVKLEGRISKDQSHHSVQR